MSRVWCSGFETGETETTVTEWATTQVRTNFTLPTTGQRSGVYCGKFDGAVSDAADNFVQSNINWALTEVYGRVYVYISAAPTTNPCDFYWGKGSSGQNLWIARLTTSRTVTLLYGATTVGTSTATIPIGAWTCVEVHYIASTTVGVVELKIANAETPDVSATGLNTSNVTVDHIRVQRSASTGSGFAISFDDLAVNSTAGTYNNSWCGAGRIAMIVPGSDTATLNWSVTGTANHYDALNDLPGTPDDLTTYISSASATTNLEDRWNMADTPAEIGASDTINALCWGVRGGSTGTSARPAILRLTDGNAAQTDSASADWGVSGWKASYPILVNERTWAVSPAALTKAYVDGIIASAIDTDATTRLIRWTAVWCCIDYTPYAAPGAFQAAWAKNSNQIVAGGVSV